LETTARNDSGRQRTSGKRRGTSGGPGVGVLVAASSAPAAAAAAACSTPGRAEAMAASMSPGSSLEGCLARRASRVSRERGARVSLVKAWPALARLRQRSVKKRHAARAGLAAQAGLMPQALLSLRQRSCRVPSVAVEKLLVAPVVDRLHEDALPATTAAFAVGQQGSEAFLLGTCRGAGRGGRVHRSSFSRLGSKEANPRSWYGG